MGLLSDSVRRLNEQVAAAAQEAGRDPAAITIVAVTKNVTAEIIGEAVRAGLTDLGENRVPEAKVKIPQVAAGVRWHLVGHLQTNKVKEAVKLFDLIQSVDSLRLAREISRQAQQIGKTQEILLQVNAADEPQKSGCTAAEAEELAGQIVVLPAIRLRGLMAIGPLTADVARVRRTFRTAKRLFDRLGNLGGGQHAMTYLSMGMSGDFGIALGEGANMLRIGTAIFGPRGR